MAEEQGEEGEADFCTTWGQVTIIHGQLWKHRVGKGRNQEVSRTQRKAQWVFTMLWEVRWGSGTKTRHTRERHKALACSWCQKQGGTNRQWGPRGWQCQTASQIHAFSLFPLPGILAIWVTGEIAPAAVLDLHLLHSSAVLFTDHTLIPLWKGVGNKWLQSVSHWSG